MKLRRVYGHIARKIRQQNSMSLRELSERSHISIGHLSEFERGIKEMSSELFPELCKGLNCNQSDILLEAYRMVAREENKR